MFIPNTTALLYRRTGRTAFSQAEYANPIRIPIGIANLNVMKQSSAVRADAAASRGDADIETAKAEFLIPKNVKVSLQDVIEVLGQKIEISGIDTRFSIRGTVDHYQLSGVIKGDFM